MPLRNTVFWCCLLVIATTSFAAPLTAVAVDFEESWDAKLSRGYVEKQPALLAECLDVWHKESKAVTAAELKKKPAIERETYGVYEAFFEQGKYLKAKPGYFVVQDSIKVVLEDSDFKTGVGFSWEGWDDFDKRRQFLLRTADVSELVIHNFRPDVSAKGKKRLFLNYKMQRELLLFLMDDEDRPIIVGDLGDGWMLGNEYADSKERIAYLNQHLDILPGHFGSGWHLPSQPILTEVYFNLAMDRAFVFYREGYSGGDAFIVKQLDGKWKMTYRDSTWDE